MKTTMALVLAFVMLVAGACFGYYFGALHGKRNARSISATAEPVPTTGGVPIGKFQIVPGEYLYTSGNTGTTQHGMFRINTETGEAGLYREFVDEKGKLQMFWTQIDQ
jgi:hypothetical protein